jgi:HD-GYP domain-containing protein (c-di-GMP phosphodiesterase class II)
MKTRVNVEDLRPGMYVVELDRPWLETPFLFQGFAIESDQDLARLRSCCRFVYVDEARGEAAPSRRRPTAPRRPDPPRREARLTGLPPVAAAPSPRAAKVLVPFEEEVHTGRRLHDQTKAHIYQMFRDVRLGRSVDTAGARILVKGMVGSIMRNPNALIWMTQLKNRDEYTALHSLNVCVLSVTFGRHLGLGEEALVELGMGALMHDIGKIKVPLDVLNKPGRLTLEEFDLMKQHPLYGRDILNGSRDLSSTIIDVAYSHHERMSGHGYPLGKTGDAISRYGKMVAIVDVYDAITSDRVYHTGMSAIEALKRLYEWRKDSFDEYLVEQFIQCLGIYPVGTTVELTTGEIGLVVAVNETAKLKPKVVVVMDADKRPCRPHRIVDLERESRRSGGGPSVRRVLESGSYGIRLRDGGRVEMM